VSLLVLAATQPPFRSSRSPLLPVPSHAGVLHDRSFAKYAAAFFKKSRSWVTNSSSRRKRRTSCSALATLPCPGNTSVSVSSLASTCCFQWRSISQRIPSCSATLDAELPFCTSRTASNLNSRVYFRFADMNTSSRTVSFRVFLGVHKIRAGPFLLAQVLCTSAVRRRGGLRKRLELVNRAKAILNCHVSRL